MTNFIHFYVSHVKDCLFVTGCIFLFLIRVHIYSACSVVRYRSDSVDFGNNHLCRLGKFGPRLGWQYEDINFSLGFFPPHYLTFSPWKFNSIIQYAAFSSLKTCIQYRPTWCTVVIDMDQGYSFSGVRLVYIYIWFWIKFIFLSVMFFILFLLIATICGVSYQRI